LAKVEAEEDHMLEEDEEAHTKVEVEATLQAQVEGAVIKIQVKAQPKIFAIKLRYLRISQFCS